MQHYIFVTSSLSRFRADSPPMARAVEPLWVEGVDARLLDTAVVDPTLKSELSADQMVRARRLAYGWAHPDESSQPAIDRYNLVPDARPVDLDHCNLAFGFAREGLPT